VQILDVTGPLEVFSQAPGFETQLATPRLEPILETSRGIALANATLIAQIHDPIDTLIIAGGPGAESGHFDRTFINWIAQAAPGPV